MRDAGRPEERHLVADGEAEAEQAATAEDWRLAALSSEEEDEWLQERLQRPTKRRKKQRQPPDEAAERAATVAVRPASELAWRFAAAPLAWQAAPGIDLAAPAELTLTLAPGSCDIRLALTGSVAADAASSSCGTGGTCQGTLAAPTAEAAEALVSLLRSGHLWCGLHGVPAPKNGHSGASGGPAAALHLSLGDKALAEAAEHPEEQQQVGQGLQLWECACVRERCERVSNHPAPQQCTQRQPCCCALWHMAALLCSHPPHAHYPVVFYPSCSPRQLRCAPCPPTPTLCSASGTATYCSCCWAGWHRTWTPSGSWSIRQPQRLEAPPLAARLPLLPPLLPRSCSAARCAAPGLPRSRALPPLAPAGLGARQLLMRQSSMRR